MAITDRWFLHTGHFCIELVQLGPEVLSDHNKEVAAIEQRCDTTRQETFEGENFRKFQGFVAVCKRFLHEIWGCGIFCESFLYENLFSTNSRKFSPTKVSCYTVVKQPAKSQIGSM